ncbi:MAG: VRR-NUC domain-containing protein [Pseudomonadota bacterium]
MPAAAAPQPAPELPPRYYHDNFLALLTTVLARYRDVLSAEELAWLNTLTTGLSTEAQCLYLRLAFRVGPWFRQSRLHYPEIGDIPAPLAELFAAGLVTRPEDLPAHEMGRLFTVAELRNVFPELATTGGKPALLAALAELGPELQETVCAYHREHLLGPVGGDVLNLLQLLFFGSFRHSLTDFVLADLGVQRFYPYALEQAIRKFDCREAVDEYLALATFRQLWNATVEADDRHAKQALAAELTTLTPHYEAAAALWSRICNRVARELERSGDFDLALALYGGSQQHPARERRARVLEAQGDWQSALSLCDDISNGPWCEQELQAAERIAPRLRRRLGGPPVARLPVDHEEVVLRLAQSGASVERLAAAHFEASWQRVVYVENALLNGLFGLAYWDEIFSPQAAAFHHRYQRGPEDMFTRDFAERRSKLLTARRAELAAGPIKTLLLAAYDRYFGYDNYWVNWRFLDREFLAEALDVIPAAHLLAIWDRQLFDPGENRKGFPDLIALNQRQGDYCLIEVKGPGDRLQDGQRRWLRYFMKQSIPCSVARVAWQD